MKKLLLVLVGVLLFCAVSFAVLMNKTFSGLSAIPEEKRLGPGVVGVADGLLQAFLMPDGYGGAVLNDCV